MGRLHLRASMALAACLVAVLAAAGPTAAHDPGSAASPTSALADVDGRVISIDQIPDWYCHDLDFPHIHCFATATELQRALADHVAAAPVGATASAPYLNIYDNADWSGAYTAISQPYNDLRTIGWNDRISSFKALNGVAGHFATDIYNSGYYYFFCCNQQTTYVGDAWNDTFSSVYPW